MNLIELLYAYRNLVRSSGKALAEEYLISVGAGKTIRDELSICVDSKGNFVDFECNPFDPDAAEDREAKLDRPV